jgi:hypothetical protein
VWRNRDRVKVALYIHVHTYIIQADFSIYMSCRDHLTGLAFISCTYKPAGRPTEALWTIACGWVTNTQPLCTKHRPRTPYNSVLITSKVARSEQNPPRFTLRRNFPALSLRFRERLLLGTQRQFDKCPSVCLSDSCGAATVIWSAQWQRTRRGIYYLMHSFVRGNSKLIALQLVRWIGFDSISQLC